MAERSGHPQLEPIHLLAALLAQEGGLVVPVLQKIGIESTRLKLDVMSALDKLPKQKGGDVYLSSDLRGVIHASEDEAQKLKDEYISTEHMLLALAASKSDVGTMLKNFGATRDELLKAIQSIRGSAQVTSNNPEASMQALEKYGKDLTALARQGKLDPVIGRDEEIRRVIQVLSRRTKNNPVLIGEPGVGKTAIAEGLAQRIIAG